MSRRRASGPAKSYALSLRGQVGAEEASRISKRVILDPITGRGLDAFEELPDPLRPWHKPLRLESLTSDDVSKLINALLDHAGRDGRRRNNRVNRAGLR